jgi:hypothetical protein
MENLSISMISQLKIELFHPIRIPLEFPTEGEKAYLLKHLGALKTEDCTRAFINFFFYSIAFIFGVDSSDVPIEDVPASIQTRV